MGVKYLGLRGTPELVTGMTVMNTGILVKCFLLVQEARSYSLCSLTPPTSSKDAVG